MQRTSLKHQSLQLDCIFTGFSLLKGGHKGQLVQSDPVPTGCLLASIDEHHRMKQLSQVPLLPLYAARLDLDHPLLHQQQLSSKFADPVRGILTFRPKLLPIFRQSSTQDSVGNYFDFCCHETLSLENVVEGVQLTIDAISKQQGLRSLKVNERLDWILGHEL